MAPMATPAQRVVPWAWLDKLLTGVIRKAQLIPAERIITWRRQPGCRLPQDCGEIPRSRRAYARRLEVAWGWRTARENHACEPREGTGRPARPPFHGCQAADGWWRQPRSRRRVEERGPPADVVCMTAWPACPPQLVGSFALLKKQRLRVLCRSKRLCSVRLGKGQTIRVDFQVEPQIANNQRTIKLFDQRDRTAANAGKFKGATRHQSGGSSENLLIRCYDTVNGSDQI